MKKSKLSAREIVMLAFLAVLVIGMVYYLGFYTPLQNELTSIANQASDVDTQIATSMSKIKKMDDMQAELDEVFSRPASEITEIAPYDNKEVVLNQLYGILSRTRDYSLSFTDPEVQDDGIVRRNISMKFTCSTYAAAKRVIKDLTDSQWRCLVSNLSIASEDDDIMTTAVNVTATITFFEHTGLA